MPTTNLYTTTVAYSGTNYGRVYLNDVGGRNQLGSGLGIYHLGQDQYINPGQTLVLQTTGDVLLSKARGRIKKFVDRGAFVVTNN